MKHDAIVGGHRDRRARADPRRADPGRRRVEMEAKKAAGYFAEGGGRELRMFAAGALVATGDPLRADADGLAPLDAERSRAASRSGRGNPLVGLEGRAGLLRRLGEAVAQAARSVRPTTAGRRALVDHLAAAERGRAAGRGDPRACSTGWRRSGPAWHRARRRRLGDVGRTRRGPAIATTGWCRSTSCRSGSPTR
jgi:hypothetical protein